MRSHRRHVATLAMTALGLTLVGFAAPPVPAAAAEARTTLTVATMWEALPLAMAPRRSRFFNESEILDTLIKLDHDMNLVPGLAVAWARESPTRWVFTLRDGVRFHDDTPLDAAAVKHALERIVDLLPYAADLLNLQAIEVRSPLEVVIETAAPFAALPNQLTDAITVIYAPSSFDAAGQFVQPIGTGPWRFVAYAPQDRTVVERFDGYWDEAPALERIVYRYIPDHESRVLALETGEVDFADNLPPASVARLDTDPRFQVHAEPTAGLYYGAFNTAAGEPLGDRRVRLALNHLIDRDLIVTGAFDGIGRPAWQFFGPQFAWVPKGVAPHRYDAEAAAALLAEAGYTRVGGRWQKDGQALSLRLVSYATRTEMAVLTEAVAVLLRQAGIDSDVQLYTWEGMLERVRRGDYDVSLVFWTPEMTAHPDLHLKSQFHSAAAMNHQNWAHPRFDALVDHGRTLDPGSEWDATYLEALQILQDEAPILPLVHNVYVAGSDAGLVGYRVHPSGFFHDFKSVRWAD